MLLIVVVAEVSSIRFLSERCGEEIDCYEPGIFLNSSDFDRSLKVLDKSCDLRRDLNRNCLES